jgi:hypothetical protein
MKNTRGLLLSCLSGALVVVGILGWRIVQGPRAATPGAVSMPPPTDVPGNTRGSVRSSDEPVATGSILERGELSTEQALEALRRDPLWKWKRPITFWGLVLDEQGLPVPGARVEMTWTDLSSDGHSSETITSDATGRVRLEGEEGAVLTVRASDGAFYSTKEAHRILNYAEPWDPQFHRPNPDQPVVLRLRRKGLSEPLVHRENLRFQVTSATGEVRIDLVGQREVPSGGDLRITVHHGPERVVGGRRRFDWDMVISPVDGGMVAHAEEFPFMAPETGYLPEVRYSQSAEDPGWQDGFEGRFFLRTRNGKAHARIELRVSPFPRGAPPTVTVLDYHLNPSGSRNLEYTPDLDVSSDHYDRARAEPR